LLVEITEIVQNENNYYKVTFLYTFDDEKFTSSNDIISALKIDEDEVEKIITVLSLEKKEDKNEIYYVSQQRRKAEEYNKKFVDRIRAHSRNS
jgi:DNA-directed RNA polymerase subunit M/transcription elongation factor TFIIS